MTLREKVGQLFMIGFSGTTVSKDLTHVMGEYRPGGVILFSRNLKSVDQIVKLTNALQKLAPSERLFIAIDQEGGRVSRLPEGFTIFPPCAVLGQCDSSELVYAASSATAVELRAVGINMNMAPVLDVNTNPDNPIIGDRAFSASANQVSALGLATVAGLQDNKVMACGKHFPGHGDTSVDSHLELPKVSLSPDRIREVEIRPFRHAMENELASIMTAHVVYSALDDASPATLSSYILTAMLRKELDFQGLIVTDDLEMRAIVDHYGIGEAAVLAFRAGADMLLLCKEQEHIVAAMETVYEAVKKGEISEARLDTSLKRIAQAKQRFLHPYTPVDTKAAKSVVGSQAHKTIIENILKTSERRKKKALEKQASKLT